VPDPEDPATFERSRLTWRDGPQNRDMLDWYRQLLSLRKEYVTGSARTADARYADGVLTMLVPAQEPRLMVRANLHPGTASSAVASGWRQGFSSDEDGYHVAILTP